MTVERFDKWLSENFYPAMAGMVPELIDYRDNMTGDVAARYAELCAGKPENRFAEVLREKVYPILAWMQTFSSTS